jgi:ketosteroid isomerase-like protein
MSQENVEITRNAWEAFGRGDMDGATADDAPNSEMVIPETLPWGGTYVGKDGFMELMGKLGQHFEEFSTTPERIIDGGENTVIVVAGQKGRTKAGNDMEGRVMWLYELNDGQITRAEFFGDTARALEAVGEHAHA